MTVREQISRHVHLIRAPIGAAFVAIYAIVGQRVTLVDTGYAHHPLDTIEPGLADIGLSLRDIDLVLTTHGHGDHAGGLSSIVASSDAQVAIHPADAHRLSGASVTSEPADEFALAFRRLSLSERASEREAMLLESSGSAIQIRHLLAGGDRIDLGSGLAVDVVAAPGHTPGSVAFIVQPDGIALVGDAIQGQGGGSGLPLYLDPGAYRTSLLRLADLEVSSAGLGHSFRSAHRSDGWPVVPPTAWRPLIAESAAFPAVAAHVAADVVSMGPTSIAEAAIAFLRGLPEPYGPGDTDLATVGGASLHAALLHLDLAARSTGTSRTLPP